jgi:hypothetical protein
MKMMNNETLRKRVKEGDFKDIENWDVSNVTDMNGLFFDERLPRLAPQNPELTGLAAEWFYL